MKSVGSLVTWFLWRQEPETGWQLSVALLLFPPAYDHMQCKGTLCMDYHTPSTAMPLEDSHRSYN